MWADHLVSKQMKVSANVGTPTDVLQVTRKGMRWLKIKDQCDRGGVPVAGE